MIATINDQQLDVELQELYLTGKQWLSDLDFLENEQSFLKDLLLCDSGEFPALPALRPGLLRRLIVSAIVHQRLRADITNFMNKLAPLVVHTDTCIHLQLIGEFTLLQSDVDAALSALKGIKYAIVNARRPE